MATKAKRKKKSASIGVTIAKVFRNIFLTIFLIILFGGVIGGGIVAGALFGYMETVEPIEMENMKLNFTSFIYGSNSEGEIVELERLYDDENRIWVDLDDIPEDLQNAFIAIEDERFYKHHGFDVKRTFGAAVNYIKNKITGSEERTYGGSTITQQLIKNLTDEDDYKLERKIQEIYRAYKLEKELSKEEILEYYLNTIFLSEQCNGVSSAAETYFGKSVSELTLAQCASIAGITQSPTKYNPYLNPQEHKSKQELVLKKMLELNMISGARYEEAMAEELTFMPPHSETQTTTYSYYIDAVIDQVLNDLMEKYDYTKDRASRYLYNGGLKIYIAQDPAIQEAMDSVYSDSSSFPKLRGEVQPESAMVIMDPYTGQVKALCGGRGEKEGKRTLNRATQSLRQPGSSIKPISVYGPAMEYGLITPSTIVKDSPITIDGWTPKNDDRSFRGNITVRSALIGSRNVPAVKICRYLGVENSFKHLVNRMHITSLVDYRESNGHTYSDKGLASLALGGLTDGVSVLELTAAYCSFVNDGYYNKPFLYTKVTDVNGETILESSPTHEIAFSEKTAYNMLSMMKDAVAYGTGKSANFSGMAVAGKTGTTGSGSTNDRWFAGCTPYYVGAVWFGYDQPKNLSGLSYNPAAAAWRKVMQKVHSGLEYKDFEKPGKEVSVMICRESGQLANPDCEHVIGETYSSSAIPKTRCELHPLQTGKKSYLTDGKAVSSESGSSSTSKSSTKNDKDKDENSDEGDKNENSGSSESSGSSGNSESSSSGSESSSEHSGSGETASGSEGSSSSSEGSSSGSESSSSGSEGSSSGSESSSSGSESSSSGSESSSSSSSSSSSDSSSADSSSTSSGGVQTSEGGL